MISGELDHKPELPILLALTAEPDPAILRRWLRTPGPRGRPLDLLVARDFAAFEDALGVNVQRRLGRPRERIAERDLTMHPAADRLHASRLPAGPAGLLPEGRTHFLRCAERI